MSVKIVNKREQQVERKDEAKQVVTGHSMEIHSHRHITKQERMKIYNGEDSSSLTQSSLKRVRELQTVNEELQRQIATSRHECSLSHDPLKIMNDIEYMNSTIARNTGEILNIFTQNEKRLAQIAELEKQNINLQQEITDTMSSFATNNDQDQKTEFASEYFDAKSSFDANIAILQQLKTAA